MTPERMMIKLAEWAGWEEHNSAPQGSLREGWATWKSPNGKWLFDPPDYCSDLNAVHELEARLSEAEWRQYYCCVQAAVVGVVIQRPADIYWMHASALQRCEALCRTLGLWEGKEVTK